MWIKDVRGLIMIWIVVILMLIGAIWYFNRAINGDVNDWKIRTAHTCTSCFVEY